MRAGPFPAGQLEVPSWQGVRRDQGREPFTRRAQPLEQGQDDPVVRSDPWTIHLAAKDTDLLGSTSSSMSFDSEDR